MSFDDSSSHNAGLVQAYSRNLRIFIRRLELCMFDHNGQHTSNDVPPILYNSARLTIAKLTELGAGDSDVVVRASELLLLLERGRQ